MLSVLLMVVATQATGQDPVKLASMGFNRVKVSAALATSFEETFALRLNETKLVRVTTPRDVASILGADRQKQLLGCADESTSSCLAELAGALGAEGLITGEVAQVGKLTQLTIKILSPKTGQPLFTSLKRLKGEEAVLEELDRVALEAAKELHAALRPPPQVVVEPPKVAPKPEPVAVVTTAPPPPASNPRLVPWLVTGAGAAVLVAGGIVQGLAIRDYIRLGAPLRGEPIDDGELKELKVEGPKKQLVGLSLLGAGGAVALGGLVWALVTPVDQPTRVSAWASANAGGLVVSGKF